MESSSHLTSVVTLDLDRGRGHRLARASRGGRRSRRLGRRGGVSLRGRVTHKGYLGAGPRDLVIGASSAGSSLSGTSSLCFPFHRLRGATGVSRRLLDLLEQHDLVTYLSSNLTQDDFAITKPDPRYYEQILARSGRAAERSVMVGDRIDDDVIPAKAVGMRTIRV
ncbi:MAG: HAD family hydrolase, partial [Actinomycetes bacterium]